MRSRIFRRIGIAHRGPVLDLGAGPGVVTAELRRRSRGPVFALDRDPIVHEAAADTHVVADATELPLDSGHFGLVYVQYMFMWNDAQARRLIAREIARVLKRDGVLIAVEPDWGAALEHPSGLAIAPEVCLAIARAGGEPHMGRRLPAELRNAGLDVRVEQAPEIGAPDPLRFAAVEDLPFTQNEQRALAEARRSDRELPDDQKMVHVPQLFVTAHKP